MQKRPSHINYSDGVRNNPWVIPTELSIAEAALLYVGQWPKDPGSPHAPRPRRFPLPPPSPYFEYSQIGREWLIQRRQ
jgi:hypothetical protein